MLPLEHKVAIIILNWNGLNDTIECLESIRKIDYPNYDIIVIDNGSTDSSPEILKMKFSEITLIANKKNLGYAEGNNVGIRYALKNRADYIFILNNDTIVDSAILKEFINAAEEHKDAGIFGAKIYYYSEPTKIWFTGGEWDKNRMSFSHIGFNEFDNNGKYNETRIIDYACGCALFFKKEVAEKVGMFDPRFYLTFEEADWCYRAKESGFKSLYIPNAKVWHKISISFGGSQSPLYLYFSARNKLLFGRKNLPLLKRIFFYYKSILIDFFPHTNKFPFSFKRIYWDLSNISKQYKTPQFQARILGVRDFLINKLGNAPQHLRKNNFINK